MNVKVETQSIALEYKLPNAPTKVWRALTDTKLLAAWLMANQKRPQVGHGFEHTGFMPGNAFAFDGARKDWERMPGAGSPEVLARVARSDG
jgi:uncharacterized protein YndB with AHSA1/START domain